MKIFIYHICLHRIYSRLISESTTSIFGFDAIPEAFRYSAWLNSKAQKILKSQTRAFSTGDSGSNDNLSLSRILTTGQYSVVWSIKLILINF